LRSGTVATTSADDTISYAAALTSVTSMKVDQASCDLFAIANVIHTMIHGSHLIVVPQLLLFLCCHE
jgi:hypothetical protein